MKQAATLLFLTLSLLLLSLVIFPAQAAPISQATPRPTPTYKACLLCEEGLPLPVAHAVLFWMNGCSHCHEVLDNVLPPLQEKYGAQLEIQLVEVINLEDVNRLYEIGAAYNLPREQVGVPFLIIGEHALVGSHQIPKELPGLIEQYLAQGGAARPSISNLKDFLVQTTPTSFAGVPAASGAVVQASLFTTPDCHDCQLITAQALEPLKQRYGDQFEVQVIDVITSADVEYLYQVAAGYGFAKETVDLPLLILGDQVLMVEEIPARLPDLVENTLERGGVGFPSLPARPGATTTDAPAAQPAVNEPNPDVVTRSNGFALAIGAIFLMAAALIYSLIAIALGKTFYLPIWLDGLVPLLIVIGIGAAGYLSYVETQAVEAICGPVGDCNTVQQSDHARLFNILPVGVLGLAGYFALLAVWLVRRFIPKLEKPAAIGFWGMSFLAVLFSLYLTYLEPFVIRAVCSWCLASAMVLTLLLLLATPPAVRNSINQKQKRSTHRIATHPPAV